MLTKSRKEKNRAILGKIIGFVKSREDIRLAVMLGSQARIDQPADDYSDIDISIVSTQPETLLRSVDWIDQIGAYSITFVERTADGKGLERRVLFRNGVDVDFSVQPYTAIQERLVKGWSTDERPAASRGVILIVYKQGIFKKYRKIIPPKRPPARPNESEYQQSVNDFLYHWVWTARKLRRGEVWTARECCDCYMKELLLQMIEWEMRSSKGWDYETWHRGRFIEEWAEPEIIRNLAQTYARYDKADVSRALEKTVQLYTILAQQVADRMHFQYPTRGEHFVRDLVDRLSLTTS